MNDAVMATRVGLVGLSLIFSYESAILDYLKEKWLRKVLKRYCPRYPGFYLYYPTRRHMSLKLRHFIDFMTEKLS